MIRNDRVDNLKLARQAFSGLEAHRIRRSAQPGARRELRDHQPYFDLLADDVVLRCSLPAGTPLGGEWHGKAAVMEFFTVRVPQVLDDVRLEEGLEFVGNRDRIVVLGRESYTIRRSGLAVRNKAFAITLDFRDRRITHDLQIREMTEFVDVCRSARA